MTTIIFLSLVYICHSQNCATKCYYVDETLTVSPNGAHSCDDDCDCWSVRTCSTHGWCQGTDTYHDEPDCAAPTGSPSPAPTQQPTPSPTPAPTQIPTKFPTKYPSISPTSNPIRSPTKDPSAFPTVKPSAVPTTNPTKYPTQNPLLSPSANPSLFPSKNPTVSPSQNPSLFPSKNPTKTPTLYPTQTPTKIPSIFPTQSSGASDEQKEYESTYNTQSNEARDNAPVTVTFSDDYLLKNWYILVGTALIVLCFICVVIACIMYRIESKKQKLKNGQTNSAKTGEIVLEGMDRVMSMSHTNNLSMMSTNDIEMFQTPNSESQPNSVMPIMITPMNLMQPNPIVSNKNEHKTPMSDIDLNTAGNDMSDENQNMGMYDQSNRTKGNDVANDEEYEYYYEDEEDGGDDLYADPNVQQHVTQQ